MLTDDEKSKLYERYIGENKLQEPNWLDIKDLLNFAEELRTKCDNVSNRMVMLKTLQIFSSFVIAIISVIIIAFVGNIRISSIHEIPASSQFNIISWIPLFLPLLFIMHILFLVAIESCSRRTRNKVKSDLRALNLIVNLLRDNHNVLAKNLSELQKTHLKVKLSRFDVETSIPKSLFDLQKIKILIR